MGLFVDACKLIIMSYSDSEPDPMFVVGITPGIWVRHVVGTRVTLDFDDRIPWMFAIHPDDDPKAFAKALDGEGCHEFDDIVKVIKTAILWGATMYIDEDHAKLYGKEGRDYKTDEVFFNTYWVEMKPSDWDPEKLS